MKDQLISFETAKLAKEKGFSLWCHHRYSYRENKLGNLEMSPFVKGMVKPDPNQIFAPTQSLLQKWIREIHKLDIEIECYWKDEKEVDTLYVPWVKCNATEDEEAEFFNIYEEALESALKEALNLIQNA